MRSARQSVLTRSGSGAFARQRAAKVFLHELVDVEYVIDIQIQHAQIHPGFQNSLRFSMVEDRQRLIVVDAHLRGFGGNAPLLHLVGQAGELGNQYTLAGQVISIPPAVLHQPLAVALGQQVIRLKRGLSARRSRCSACRTKPVNKAARLREYGLRRPPDSPAS